MNQGKAAEHPLLTAIGSWCGELEYHYPQQLDIQDEPSQENLGREVVGAARAA